MEGEEVLSSIHRHVRLLLLIDILLGTLVARPWNSDGVKVIPGAIWALAFVFTMISWSSFRRRQPRGLRLVGIALVWFGTMLIAAGVEITIDTLRIEGANSRTLEGLLLSILGLHSLLRLETISDERFQKWYDSGAPSMLQREGVLRLDEQRAICPHCTSLLAVVPSSLGHGDACPHCRGSLVISSQESE